MNEITAFIIIHAIIITIIVFIIWKIGNIIENSAERKKQNNENLKKIANDLEEIKRKNTPE